MPASATPVLVPSFVQNMPTKISQSRTNWRLMASWGLIPACGVACVSHFTGSNTTPSAVACCAFQSLTASVAACRSSIRSDGDAMRTRYACRLKGINDNISETVAVWHAASPSAVIQFELSIRGVQVLWRARSQSFTHPAALLGLVFEEPQIAC